MFKIISLALLLIAACLVAVIILRKIPQLSLIDVGAVAKSKEEEVKERILLERLQRKFEALKRFFKIIISWLGKFKTGIQNGWQRLKSLERAFKIKDTSDAAALLKEAEGQLSSSPENAEKIYLEIIKIDPQNIAAYEGLTEIYLSNKEWSEARQVLKFLLKLNPASAVKYNFALAKIEFENGNFHKVVILLSKIIKTGCVEPRYLDFFIEAAILDKDKDAAEAGLRLLKEINPENAKIGEFEKRISELIY